MGAPPVVRDMGLLDWACHRPAAQAWGDDASLTNNHALIDGNKRTAWLATVVFLRLNGAAVTAVDGYDSAPARMVLAGGGCERPRSGGMTVVIYWTDGAYGWHCDFVAGAT
jgi:death-on-curing protein